MASSNIFEGNSCRASLTRTTYKLLMSRQWINYTSILESYLGEKLDYNVSNHKQYGELKKAVPQVIRMIREKDSDSIKERGNNRNKEYCYTGKDNDPLKDFINAVVIKDLQTYWQFCQDSAGFFPMEWLNHFFRNSQDLLDIKDRKIQGEDIISTSLDRKLKNLKLLPTLYEAIRQQNVVSFDYKQSYREVETLVFHPQYLREYNGRWFLFGKIEGKDFFPSNVALDRIGESVEVVKDVDYVPAPKGFYAEYFSDLVGVSHKHNATAVDVRLRAHTFYCYNLIDTKPIHHTQHPLTTFDGTSGDFLLHVEPNNEFIGRILQMGDQLEIVAPEDLRQLIADRISGMAKRYAEMVPNEKELIK